MAAKTRHKKWAIKIQHCPISSKFDMCVDNDVLIDSQHWKISTSRHFQNGRYNTAKIQHCPISTPFHMWVDYDVPNWFLTLKNFYRSPFSKWPPQCRKNSTLFDFNVLNWFPTSKNFYRSPFSKWPPQIRKNSTLFDFKGSFWFIFLNLLSVASLGDSIIIRL